MSWPEPPNCHSSRSQLHVKCHRVCHWMSVDQPRLNRLITCYHYNTSIFPWNLSLTNHIIIIFDVNMGVTSYPSKFYDLDSHIYLFSAANAGQWGYNTGCNENKAGKQTTGKVRMFNGPRASERSFSVTGSINTGGNTNTGSEQQTGGYWDW